ncbi:hypothetical protein [Streptomyces sp. HSG2]|uniref:hypothetical protein n=1 Tax=Streptomyces sp. HSG2 TaxID=2797167 RepID=UPI001A911D39|nr:hypothetical protein [Streptomyces sp. HSG2]
MAEHASTAGELAEEVTGQIARSPAPVTPGMLAVSGTAAGAWATAGLFVSLVATTN